MRFRAAGGFFPQGREGLDGGVDAMMGGTRVLDGEGCLRVTPQRGPAWIPVWPANLEFETGDGKTRITDEGGGIVAEVGKEVLMGGGQIGLPKDVVSQRTARDLRDRCPGDLGDYWVSMNPSMGLAIPER